MSAQIYMDNAATSFPKAPGVSSEMKRYLDEVGCNIGRGSYSKSTAAGLAVYEVRERAAALFGCSDPRRVVFTAGATASLNMAIGGTVSRGDAVLISSMEHNAVIRPLVGLGCEMIRIPSDPDGRMRLDLLQCDWERIRLCVCTHASNVSGTIQPAEELAQICAQKDIPFVLDAAQSAGHLEIDLEKNGFSAVCIPGHKGIRGPQGTGMLILSERFSKTLRPVVFGGTGSRSHCDQMPPFLPDRFEAGTLNLPGIFGIGAALRVMDTKVARAEEQKKISRFLKGLKGISGIRVPGPEEPSQRVAVFSIDFCEKDNAEAADELEQRYGILTRCGLHCAPEAHKTLGTFPQGAVRFSFSEATTEKEIDVAIDALRMLSRGADR